VKFLLILYSLLVIFFYIPIIAASIFLFLRGKEPRAFQRIGFGLPRKNEKTAGKPSIWLHGASVGEMRSIAPLVAWLRKHMPQYNVMISTTSETGYAMARKELKPDVQFLLPMEHPFAISWLLKEHDVRAVVIIETELWPILIVTASNKKVPLILLNGRISDKTLKRYCSWDFFWTPILLRFSQIFAKSTDDVARFQAICTDLPVESIGNIKYNPDSPHAPINKDVAAKLAGKRIAIAASTHAPEEELFLDCAASFKASYDVILLAPRHIKRAQEICELAKSRELTVGLYSEADFDKDIVVVDEFGLLESIYQLAERIFIGGSFANIGGHNVFEALQYKKTVCTGPVVHNFKELIPLGAQYGVVSILNDKAELLSYFEADDAEINAKADFESFFEAIRSQTKDKNRVVNYIRQLLGEGK
jgi:3-deoxy-D-manno-octulosonic-acid transferase